MRETACSVAVLGLGTMGGRAAARLSAVRPVRGYDPDPAASARAAAAGITACATARAAVEGADLVVLSLPRPAHVLGAAREVVPWAAPGTVVADLSTIDPDTAQRAAAVLGEREVIYLDVPVLGRPEGCGAWTLVAGGPAAAVDGVRPLLEASVARHVVHVGGVGAGSVVKLLNNLMFGAINAVTAEALAACQAAGVDPRVFARTVAESGAATVSNLFSELAPKIAEGDFSPVFALALLHKDNRLAVRLMEDLGVPPLLGRSIDMVNTLALRAGHGDADTGAVYQLYAPQG